MAKIMWQRGVKPRLLADLRLQAWDGDYARDVGFRTFDATEVLLRMTLDEIRNFEEHNYDSDRLSEHLQERQSHGGPFEVDVDIDGWLEVNGVDGGRKSLTQTHLDRLREVYRIECEPVERRSSGKRKYHVVEVATDRSYHVLYGLTEEEVHKDFDRLKKFLRREIEAMAVGTVQVDSIHDIEKEVCAGRWEYSMKT